LAASALSHAISAGAREGCGGGGDGSGSAGGDGGAEEENVRRDVIADAGAGGSLDDAAPAVDAKAKERVRLLLLLLLQLLLLLLSLLLLLQAKLPMAVLVPPLLLLLLLRYPTLLLEAMTTSMPLPLRNKAASKPARDCMAIKADCILLVNCLCSCVYIVGCG